MLRMMIAAVLCPIAAPLTGCTHLPPVDLCKGAETRRVTYSAVISAADGYAATGKPVPQAVMLGREAAVTALLILDAHCPPIATR